MIDVAILDAVERLLEGKTQFMLPALGQTAFQITGISNVKLLHESACATAGTIGQQIHNALSRIMYSNQDRSVYWLNVGSAAPYKPVMVDLNTDTVVFDDATARGLTSIITDNIGTVWSMGSQSGYYGLYKRSGAATWTQALSDSGAGTMYWRSSDNTYYYRSYTSNWYQLSNGAATLITAPGSVAGYTNIGYVDNYMNGQSREDYPSFTAGGVFARTGTTGAINADGSAFTNLAYDPAGDLWLATSFGPSNYGAQVKIDDTYSLFAFPTINTSSITSHHTLAIYNKSTRVIRYIGSLPALSNWAAASCINANHLRPFAAKWVDGGLRIWWIGHTYAATSSVTDANCGGGVMRCDIAYQPNF